MSDEYIGGHLPRAGAFQRDRFHAAGMARLDYAYQVFREGDGTLCAEGSTTQLFIDPEGQLMLDAPAYYRAWQARYLRIE